MTIIKWFVVVCLWALIGLVVHNQFDPNTVFGSVMGSAFIFIWFGVLIIGIFIKTKIKKEVMKNLSIIFLFTQLLIHGCSHDEKTFESGYDDGYDEGFNTQCEISKISINGHWDSAEYSKGYKVGRKDGVRACELYQEK